MPESVSVPDAGAVLPVQADGVHLVDKRDRPILVRHLGEELPVTIF